MIKSTLIKNIASNITHLSERQIADATNCIIDLMSNALDQGRRIEIRGFGCFSLHYRASRKAHNPKTGEPVVTQAKYRPHFKPGKQLRERIDALKDKKPIIDKT